MSYFISPPDNSDFQVSLDDFVASLQSKWPQLEIESVNNPKSNHLLEWKVTLDDRLLVGTLDKTQQVVHLDGDIRDCAHFAQWYQTQTVARKYTLAFYDEGYSAHVALSTGTTEQELIAPFTKEHE